MNRIDILFRKLRKERKKAFIVYITAGDPNLRATERLIAFLERSGVDLVELGIPFSDPLADGPTIQRASQRALSKGASVKAILKMTRRIRKKIKLPLVFMTYYNPVARYGIEGFIRDCKNAGVDGIIVPDLPPEEAGELISASNKREFDTIFLAAPTSTKDRLKKIAAKSKGFIYYVSLTGVTGPRDRLPEDIIRNIKAIKRITGKPICVGFGVSRPEQAKRLAGIADGVIVGSAVIKVIEKYTGRKEMYRRVSEFVRKIRKAIDSSLPLRGSSE